MFSMTESLVEESRRVYEVEVHTLHATSAFAPDTRDT